MTDIEDRLRDAMRAAVDGERPAPDLLRGVLRRHRRYLVRVAGTAVAAAAVLVAVPVAVASSLGKPAGGTAVMPGTHPHRSPSSGPGHKRHEPSWMRGRPMPVTVNLRLLVTARDPVWFTSPADTSQPIAGLPRSAYPYSITRIGGGWAAALSPACHCQSPKVPVYFIADGSAVARRVGVAQAVYPGQAPGTIWLQTRVTSGRASMVMQVTASGRTIGSPVRLPAGFTIQQGAGSALLLAPASQGPGTVTDELWNPRTRRVTRTFPGVIAASGSQVAWGICPGCAVHVLDLRTGVARSVRVPARTWAYDGQFSSDGRYLAVHLSGGVNRDGYATLSRIAIAGLRTGRLTVLPGSSIGNDLPEALTFGWQGGSDTLIATVTGRAVTQAGLWRPGSARLLVRRFWLPPGMTVVTGPWG